MPQARQRLFTRLTVSRANAAACKPRSRYVSEISANEELKKKSTTVSAHRQDHQTRPLQIAKPRCAFRPTLAAYILRRHDASTLLPEY